jgi:DNA repair exonuclease SbcCD ATPase subunit
MPQLNKTIKDLAQIEQSLGKKLSKETKDNLQELRKLSATITRIKNEFKSVLDELEKSEKARRELLKSDDGLWDFLMNLKDTETNIVDIGSYIMEVIKQVGTRSNTKYQVGYEEFVKALKNTMPDLVEQVTTTMKAASEASRVTGEFAFTPKGRKKKEKITEDENNKLKQLNNELDSINQTVRQKIDRLGSLSMQESKLDRYIKKVIREERKRFGLI